MASVELNVYTRGSTVVRGVGSMPTTHNLILHEFMHNNNFDLGLTLCLYSKLLLARLWSPSRPGKKKQE